MKSKRNQKSKSQSDESEAGMIRFGQDVCGNLDASLRREWLETNGIGGFASSSINGINARRYHGLLVAATKPPVGRFVLLSKFEETLRIGDRTFDLSANRYPGVVHPQGFRYLKEFRLDPFPIFTYDVEGIEIEKTIFLKYGENTTVVQYTLNSPLKGDICLELRPLVAFRDYHSLTHENGSIDGRVDSHPNRLSITPYQGLSTLHLAHNASSIDNVGQWYKNFEYDAERERGLDYSEDLFNPCMLRFDFGQSRNATTVVSTNVVDVQQAVKYRDEELSRRRKLLSNVPVDDAFVKSLVAASDQFIVSRGDQKTVIAGYHWFSDWGRDTMIGLPG